MATLIPQSNLESLANVLRETYAAIDAAEGEITPEQEQALDAAHVGLQLKAEAYAAVARECEAYADASDACAATYRDRSAKLRNHAFDLRRRLQAALELAGLTRVVGPTGGATLRTGAGRVELSCEPEAVPDEFCERVRTVSRKRIAEAIRAGRELPFATLVKDRYLQWVR